MRLCNKALSKIIAALCCLCLICPFPLLASDLPERIQKAGQPSYQPSYQLPQNYLMAESATEMRDRICPTCNPDKENTPPAILTEKECSNTGAFMMMGGIIVGTMAASTPAAQSGTFIENLFANMGTATLKLGAGIVGVVGLVMVIDESKCKKEKSAELASEGSKLKWQPIVTPKYSGMQMQYQW